MGDNKGIRGNVVLVSPEGNQAIKINVPSRFKETAYCQVIDGMYWRIPTGKLKLNNVSWRNSGDKVQKERARDRQDRRLRRLLSEGWHVATPEELAEIGKVEKKNTAIVIGTTQTGNASHGGKHASGEVKNSPNAYKDGRKSRGNRGGRKDRSGKPGNKPGKRIKAQNNGENGARVFSPQPLQTNPALLKSAEESAEALARLVGRSAKKAKRGVTIDVFRLLVALETDDDPLPALETPDEKPTLRVLVTPDCSGSTQSWNGLGQAWALHLSKLPDVDIVYCENINGEFWEVKENEEVQKRISSVDIVIYLGDGDGNELCRRYASFGATVVSLDSHSLSFENPRLMATEQIGNGILYWVSSVSAKAPHTWKKGIELCLGR